MSTLRNEESVFSSPRHEDAAWASAIENDMQKSYYQAAAEVPEDRPITSTSYAPLDKGKAKDPMEFPLGHAARLARPAALVECPEGKHDADDESEQLASRPPRTNSNQTLSRPASQRSLLN